MAGIGDCLDADNGKARGIPPQRSKKSLREAFLKPEAQRCLPNPVGP